jgi:LacI family transcriptional regulator
VAERPRAPGQRPVTRGDVARYAGVSTAVVSYVVNNGPRPVAEATADRVRAAIELLGYRPNLSARALKVGSTRTLGLVLSDLVNPFFAEFALEIQSFAAAAGYAMLIANSRGDAASEHQVLDDLISRRVDGLVLGSNDARAEPLSRLRRYGIPSVLIDCAVPVPGHATLGPDAIGGSRLAVEHLIEVHGHSRVALVLGRGGRPGEDTREQGWQAATRAAALPDGPIAREAFTRDGGYAAARRLLAARNPPTAIFASSDLQGVGVLRAAHELGVRVPEDVAVVAFDGTPEAAYAWPPMTVARQPVREMAGRAVQRVLGADQPTHTHEAFPMHLLIRQSCGCPAPGTLTTSGRASGAAVR